MTTTQTTEGTIAGAYDGLVRAYLAIGCNADRAHDLAIAAMAHHAPTVAECRRQVA